MIGGDGAGSGQIDSTGDVGPVKIGGDIRGGKGTNSGSLAFNTAGDVTIGGSIVGGVGDGSGEMQAGSFGKVKIARDLAGGVGVGSGMLFASMQNGTIVGVTIGKSLKGGLGTDSGQVKSASYLGPVKISGNIVGSAGVASGRIVTTSLLSGNIKSVSVGGDIIGGPGGKTGIAAEFQLGAVNVKGGIYGAAGTVGIYAGAVIPNVIGISNYVALTSLSVGGSVERLQVLVGYDAAGNGVNGHVQLGTIKVGGDWTASDVVVGFDDTGSDGYGNNDMPINAGVANIVRVIGSITIGGTVSGTGASGDHFGFLSTIITAMIIGGSPVTVPAAPGTAPLSPITGDVTIYTA